MVNVTLFSRTVYVFKVLWCILGTLDESFLPFQRGEASIYKAADDAFIDIISALCYHFLVLRGKSFPRDCIVSVKNNDQFVWSCDSFGWNLQLKDICIKYWFFLVHKSATKDISLWYFNWYIAFYFISFKYKKHDKKDKLYAWRIYTWTSQ